MSAVADLSNKKHKRLKYNGLNQKKTAKQLSLAVD